MATTTYIKQVKISDEEKYNLALSKALKIQLNNSNVTFNGEEDETVNVDGLKRYHFFKFKNYTSTLADAPTDPEGYQEVYASSASGLLVEAGNSLINFEAQDLLDGDSHVKVTINADPAGAAAEALESSKAYADSMANEALQLVDLKDTEILNSAKEYTNNAYKKATNSVLGLVKIGYTESGKNYPVELNSEGQMFVNVPWDNTHYTAVPHAGSSTSTAATQTTNGNTYINIVENNKRSGGINIKGSGATTVTSNTNGVITISSTNTDTKVTAVGNHYTPAEDNASLLSVDAEDSNNKASWGATNLVTGVNIKRDSKGHITGLTLDSIKMPENPDTTYNAGDGLTLNNTTFSLKTAGTTILGGVKTTSTETSINGYIPCPIIDGVVYYKDTNTVYTPGAGISITNNVINNTGVHSIKEGKNNGTISVVTNGQPEVDIPVKGLKSAAYTESSQYETAGAENRANGYTNNQISAALTAAENYTNSQISLLVNGAPETLDTLKELATALGNDENFATTVTNLIGTKLPLSGGTLTGNLIFNATSNANSAYINWMSIGGNAPYIGYAKDQSDGTFIICSMEKDTTTNGVKHYKNGLSIGGGSGNLFWKGNRILDASNWSEYITTIAVFG